MASDTRSELSKRIKSSPKEGNLTLDAPLAVSRTLSSQELLGMISHWADKASLATFARVSSTWSVIAGGHLWEDLDTIIPLLLLLSPLRVSRSSGWVFTNTASGFRWDRFRLYAIYVKKLRFSEDSLSRGAQKISISHLVLETLSMTHPFGTLLPNLKQLDCEILTYANVYSVLPLIPTTIVNLSLSLGPKIPPTDVAKLVQSLTFRTPDLQAMSLATYSPSATVSPGLAGWIRQTPNLSTITLPQFYHTVEVVSAMARAAHLAAVHVDFTCRQEVEPLGTCFRSTAEEFISLRQLDADVDLKTAPAILGSIPTLAKLTSVCLSWRNLPSQKAFNTFTEALGTSCPALQDISFNLLAKDQRPKFQFTFGDLRPLLRCRHITGFALAHFYPLVLESSDIRELGVAWPQLEQLYICPDPHQLAARPGTPMEVLKNLAEHCGQLKLLALFMDGARPPVLTPELDCGVQFKHLRTLGVGTSKVPGGDLGEIAFFLASLCASDVTLNHGVSVWNLGGAGDLEDARQWSMVASVMRKVSIANSSARKREATFLARIASLEEQLKRAEIMG